MNTFMALCVSADGVDFVQDCHNTKTIKEVENKINDFGSRWFFYPHTFVVNERTKKVVSTDDYFKPFKGKTIQELKNSEKFRETCEFISSL